MLLGSCACFPHTLVAWPVLLLILRSYFMTKPHKLLQLLNVPAVFQCQKMRSGGCNMRMAISRTDISTKEQLHTLTVWVPLHEPMDGGLETASMNLQCCYVRSSCLLL